ncbi:hypothetical protein K466DRAFT_597871 [Polyporus arcularius HHB13444]|uniref:DUF6533 domain-containing protein n=1 Tax=Polyporus arcularius HHB13444 TaxID=1314778 RepID=A0A5C3PHQ7_9APHY|nr:hypothetical protein K466DRAFT_597871 [Polyporus arcularius HHB13444]
MASISPPTPAAHAQGPELQQYVGVIRDIHVANLCNVAAAAWLAYDICITFPQEVSLVWRAKWSIPKVLYFLVRYYTLISLLMMLAVANSLTVPVSVSISHLLKDDVETLTT